MTGDLQFFEESERPALRPLRDIASDSLVVTAHEWILNLAH